MIDISSTGKTARVCGITTGTILLIAMSAIRGEEQLTSTFEAWIELVAPFGDVQKELYYKLLFKCYYRFAEGALVIWDLSMVGASNLLSLSILRGKTRLLNLLDKLVKLKPFSYDLCNSNELWSNSCEILCIDGRFYNSSESSLPASGELIESFVSMGDLEYTAFRKESYCSRGGWSMMILLLARCSVSPSDSSFASTSPCTSIW